MWVIRLGFSVSGNRVQARSCLVRQELSSVSHWRDFMRKQTKSKYKQWLESQQHFSIGAGLYTVCTFVCATAVLRRSHFPAKWSLYQTPGSDCQGDICDLWGVRIMKVINMPPRSLPYIHAIYTYHIRRRLYSGHFLTTSFLHLISEVQLLFCFLKPKFHIQSRIT